MSVLFRFGKAKTFPETRFAMDKANNL